MKVIFFSPRGSTRAVAREAAQAWSGTDERDLLFSPLKEELKVPAEEPVLVAVPVYGGRVPTVCRDMLRDHLKGSGGPAVAVAVYGNRAYEDALLELRDVLEDGGFHVVGAGAFIGPHSIFPKVAAGRPDEADKKVLAQFSARCKALCDGFDPAAPGKVEVPGDPTYREREQPEVHMAPDSNDKCMKCYACFRACPAGAIPEAEPWKTEREKCISCGACIHLCPTKTRDHRGEKYEARAAGFMEKNGARKEPEIFF